MQVGYVVEHPIWKTSYRLVLPKETEDKPFLQGWAVVENPTDEDWKDVRMALVAGRPISFQMDLYTPLYVPRPMVEPELFASLRPVAYSGDLKAGTTGRWRHAGDAYTRRAVACITAREPLWASKPCRKPRQPGQNDRLARSPALKDVEGSIADGRL